MKLSKSIAIAGVVLGAFLTAAPAMAACVMTGGKATVGGDPNCFQDGKLHGQWRMEFANGTVQTGRMAGGVKQGGWTIRFANGDVHSGAFVDGVKQGEWTIRFAGGTVSQGVYADGKQTGAWQNTFADGQVDMACWYKGKELTLADCGLEEPVAQATQPAPAATPTASQTPAQTAPQLQSLLQNAGIFRQAFATDIQSTAQNLQQMRGIDDITGSALYDEYPEVWNYLFATSVVLAGNARSEAPITAYYNPFLDAAAYVLWRAGAGGYEPVAIRMRAVDEPRADTPGVARWLLDGATPNSLQAGYQIFRRQFESDYPFASDAPAKLPAAGGEENLALLESRAAQALTDLAGYLAEEADATTRITRLKVETFAVAAGENDAAHLRSILAADSALGADEIVQIPREMRAQLTPSFIVSNDSGALIYQQVPSAPSFIGVVGVTSDASNPGTAFLFMNLDIEAGVANQ